MAEAAHVFKLKTDDAYLITTRPDLASYNLPGIHASEWLNQGTVELTVDWLAKYATKPDDVIEALADNGYYSVQAQDYRFIRDHS